jgi:purine nucleoside phosphorylase
MDRTRGHPVIGGTGLYDLPGLSDAGRRPQTPFGLPSSPIRIGAGRQNASSRATGVGTG